MSFFDAIWAFDFNILDTIQNSYRTATGDSFWKIITVFGDAGIFWIVLAVMMLLFKPTRKAGLAAGIALAAGFLVGNIIMKNAFARIRPYDLNTSFTLIVKRLTDYSFPSGHTTASMGAALAMFYVNKRYGSFALVLALLIVTSRLYLYVHYPSDILGGGLIALFTSLFGFIMAELILQRFQPWFDGKLAARRAAKAASKNE